MGSAHTRILVLHYLTVSGPFHEGTMEAGGRHVAITVLSSVSFSPGCSGFVRHKSFSVGFGMILGWVGCLFDTCSPYGLRRHVVVE